MNIAVFDVDGLQTCFGLAPSAFEIIELGYTDCALKENFSVTLTKKRFTCVSLSCQEQLVQDLPTCQPILWLGRTGSPVKRKSIYTIPEQQIISPLSYEISSTTTCKTPCYKKSFLLSNCDRTEPDSIDINYLSEYGV